MPKGVPYFFMEIFCLCATVCLLHYHMSHAYSNGPSHWGKPHEGHTTQGTQDTEKRAEPENFQPSPEYLSNGPITLSLIAYQGIRVLQPPAHLLINNSRKPTPLSQMPIIGIKPTGRHPRPLVPLPIEPIKEASLTKTLCRNLL